MMHPEPFDVELDEFMAGWPDKELDIDPIFAKEIDDILDDYRRYAPDQIVIDADDAGRPSIIDPTLTYRNVEAGVILTSGEQVVGGYLGSDLSLKDSYRGRGIGTEIVIERCLSDGCSPVWHLDDASYTPEGAAAHESAWNRVRSHPEETRVRMKRLERGEESSISAAGIAA